ncbi:MAG: hypothetical protein HY909_04490 [Deltaproteobacteria bacterium]|nr:hypothetical protein [Deltaproteobacteria bacterium]
MTHAPVCPECGAPEPSPPRCARCGAALAPPTEAPSVPQAVRDSTAWRPVLAAGYVHGVLVALLRAPELRSALGAWLLLAMLSVLGAVLYQLHRRSVAVLRLWSLVMMTFAALGVLAGAWDLWRHGAGAWRGVLAALWLPAHAYLLRRALRALRAAERP